MVWLIVQDIRITTLLISQVSLRISSLDYLGVVAARLRRDAVQSRLKIDTIDAIIETVKEAEDEAGGHLARAAVADLGPGEGRLQVAMDSHPWPEHGSAGLALPHPALVVACVSKFVGWHAA